MGTTKMKYDVKAGDRFGHLVFTGEDNGKTSCEKRYHFVCDCGKDKWLPMFKVFHGFQKSCGCMPTRTTRFDVSTLLPHLDPLYPEDAELIRSGKFKMADRVHAVCRVCGKPLSYRAIKHFFFRMSHFCMCQSCTMKEVSKGGKRGVVSDRGNRGVKKENPRLYSIWKNLLNRCFNEKCNVYYLYGGRGITLCDEWKNVHSFIEWAKSSGYEETLTLDRVDSEGSYCPENCRWVSVTVQNRNKRCTRYIGDIDSKTFFENSEHDPSVTYLRFFTRYFKGGWSLQEALQTPNEGRKGKTHKSMFVTDNHARFVRDAKDYIKTMTSSHISYDVSINGVTCSVCFPDKRVAFSLVSTYESKKQKRYDNKQAFCSCLDAGFRLVTVFECDWITSRSICEQIIREAVRDTYERVYARNLVVEPVSCDTARQFFDLYHVDKFSERCVVSYALKTACGNIVSVMSFGRLNDKGSDTSRFEIVRYATIEGMHVVGGASKLFTRFVIDHQPSYVLSYSDNDRFTGNVYRNLGFENTDCGKSIDYVWFNGSEVKKQHDTTPAKLEKDFPDLCKQAHEKGKGVESYIMQSRGFTKIYRCGNSCWEWTSK